MLTLSHPDTYHPLHCYSHSVGQSIHAKLSQIKFLSKNPATSGSPFHQSPPPRSEAPPVNSSFHRHRPSLDLSPCSHTHLAQEKKVTRRASWWGAVMPVVVKEAFRHDLDSRDQRLVLRWIAVTKEVFMGFDLFEMVDRSSVSWVDQRKVLRCYGCDLPSMSGRCYSGRQR